MSVTCTTPQVQAGGSSTDSAWYATLNSAASTATPAASDADTVSLSSTGRSGRRASCEPLAAGSSLDLPVPRRLSALLSGDEEPPVIDRSPASGSENSRPCGEIQRGDVPAERTPPGSAGTPPASRMPFGRLTNTMPPDATDALVTPTGGGGQENAGGVLDAHGASKANERPKSGTKAGEVGMAGPAGRRLSGGGSRRPMSGDPEDLSPTEAAIRKGLRRSSRLRTPAKSSAQ